MKPFDPSNPEHVRMVRDSFEAADQFGLGYFSHARNVLELHDVSVGSREARLQVEKIIGEEVFRRAGA